MAAEVKTDLKEDIQEIKIRIQKMDKELASLLKAIAAAFAFSSLIPTLIKAS